MKHSEFMTAIEEIYGEYKSPLLKKMTAIYLKEHFRESELENVFKSVMIKVNPKYKTPPSPADFEDIFPRGNSEAEALKWYELLSATGCSLDNVIISDLRARNAIVSLGGWVAFCMRNPIYEELHRKKFVEAFNKPSDHECGMLFGRSSKRETRQPLMFGDKEICRLMYEEFKQIQNTVKGEIEWQKL